MPYMSERPHIDGAPLEEIPLESNGLPPEPNVSISFNDPDAIEKLEALQEEIALSHTGEPLPENTDSHEVTEDDEEELEAIHIASDIQQKLKDQVYFDKNPDMWFRSIVLENDMHELFELASAGYDEAEIERMITVIARDYPERFKRINGGATLSQNSKIEYLNLTAEEYRQKLHDAYTEKINKETKTRTRLGKIREILKNTLSAKEIELGDPIDDDIK